LPLGIEWGGREVGRCVDMFGLFGVFVEDMDE
jgi:hypothetical protein